MAIFQAYLRCGGCGSLFRYKATTEISKWHGGYTIVIIIISIIIAVVAVIIIILLYKASLLQISI